MVRESAVERSENRRFGFLVGLETMTEYALMLAAIAVVVYAIYAAKGNNIGSLASGIEFRRMRKETSRSTRRARRPESRRLAFRWRTSKQT